MNFKRQEIKDYFIENICYFTNEQVNRLIDDCELHHTLFNTDYYIIGTYKAKKWLGDKAFDVIAYIQDYEKNNFGEICTDLSNPEHVVNMYVYIIGEEIVNDFTYNLK
jgi:hypothetical protein